MTPRPAAGAVHRLAAAVLTMAIGCTAAPPPPPRVLVVGLDGATWDVARPLLAAGELPHLAGLIARGVTATPIAAEPLIPPVVWTTLFTGVPPAEHGVANWALAGSGYRRVPALWSRLDAAGKSVVLVNLPGTWKAERVRGAVVADVGMLRGYVGGAGGGAFAGLVDGPLPSPYDRIADRIRTAAAPLVVGSWSEWLTVPAGALEASVFRVKRVDAQSLFVSPLYARDLGRYAMWPRELGGELHDRLAIPYIREGPAWSAYGSGEVPAVFAEHVMQTTAVQLAAARHLLSRPWDLFVWIDPLPDRVAHAYWTEHDAAHFSDLDPSRRARHRERVRDAYRAADGHLGEILAQAPAAWIAVVSAHGFGPGRDRGEHAPAGLAVIAGPGLAGDAGEIALEDVAPTLACLLGVGRDGMRGSPLAAVVAVRPECRS